MAIMSLINIIAISIIVIIISIIIVIIIINWSIELCTGPETTVRQHTKTTNELKFAVVANDKWQLWTH